MSAKSVKKPASKAKGSKFADRPVIDIHQKVTDQVVALLEKGVRPWSQSWRGGHGLVRPLRHGGVPYRGINVLILWASAMEKGFTSPYWMTFKQVNEYSTDEKKCHVRKGEHGTMIVYYTRYPVTDKETGEERTIPVLKSFTVFNADQIEGLPEKFHPKKPEPVEAEPIARIPHVETFFDSLDLTVNHGGHRAFYMPSQDRIQLPNFEEFASAEAYYSVRGHESIHATRHEKRLNRDFGRKRWGDEGYAIEELVAELGAAFLGADLGIEVEPREDHASYLENWLTVLKGDKKFIFMAASHAEKAVALLHTMASPASNEVPDESEMDTSEPEIDRLAA